MDFAAIFLLIVGTLNIIYGIGAIDDANYPAERVEVGEDEPRVVGVPGSPSATS